MGQQVVDDELEIDVSKIDDAGKKDAQKAVPEVKIEDEPAPVRKAAEKTPEEGIEELKAKLESERRARIEAEKLAREASQQVQRANTEVEDTNLHLVNSALETVKQQSVMLKQQYSAALAAQDFDRVSEIQEAMSDLSVKKSQLEAGKTAMENRPRQEIQQPVRRAADPIDEIISQVTPQSGAWLDRNRDHLRDDRAVRRMFRAHEDAVDEGIKADTPEYFRFIEGRLGIGQDDGGGEVEIAAPAAAKPIQRRQSPPAAPVSRSGGGNGSGSNTVRLSGEEREMAQMMGMTDQEYAVNKLALQKAGKLSH